MVYMCTDGSEKGFEKREKEDDSVDNGNTAKAGRFTASPREVPVSSILEAANSILYNEERESCAGDSVILSDCDSDVSGLDIAGLYESKGSASPTHAGAMASGNSRSSGALSDTDILDYLKRIDSKVTNMEKKMEKLDILELKLCEFEKDMTRLWNFVRDSQKKTEERIEKVEEKVESAEFSVAVSREKIERLEKDRDSIREEVVYLQSQSMRNNLVFTNIDEAPRGTVEDCEQKLRDFLTEKMKIASDLVKDMSFERVHRMGQRRDRGCRHVVAKFTLFKDRETVRKQGRELRGSIHHVFEQFPKEVADKRRRLMPQMKDARRSGKRAWLSYDTLFIDGRPVRDTVRSESESESRR